MCYVEPSRLLAVSGITANLNAQGSIGSEFGIGPESNLEGKPDPPPAQTCCCPH